MANVVCWIICRFKRKLFSHKMTPILFWNIKWLFVRFTFCHRTTVTLDTQWQNTHVLRTHKLTQSRYTTEHDGKWTRYSKQLFSVSTIHLNYCLQSVTPLLNGLVDDLLVKTLPAGAHSKTFSHRSRIVIRFTELRDMPVTFSILRWLLLVPGLTSWLHMRSFTREIFRCIWIDYGRPLLTFRLTEPVLSIFHKRLLTITAHFYCWNSEQIRLAPHPFACLRILIKHFLRTWMA